MGERLRAQRAGRAGFTLIEVLAVIVILGILAGVLYSVFGTQFKSANVRLTQTYMKNIEAALSAYYEEQGEYPSSTFPAEQADGSRTNQGAECLVIALWTEGREGYQLKGEFSNTDGDEARKPPTDFATRRLNELQDRWGNPIAYLHFQDYGEEHLYITEDPDTGEKIESPVKARVDPATDSPYGRRSFQLLSAGPDGIFGTEDDITNR